MTDPVIIFDSGIGGLPLLSNLKKQAVYNIVYIADSANFPYGTKSEEFIRKRLKKIYKWSMQFKPQAFVVACNSATVNAINDLRSISSLPIIGFEPVIKPLSHFKNPALISTPITAASSTTRRLMKIHNLTNLHIISSEFLASYIEDFDTKKITNYLTSLGDILNDCDSLGLSCTHYPLIKNLISAKYPHLYLVDPTIAVANRLRSQATITTTNPKVSWYTTAEVLRLEKQVKNYLDIKVRVNKLDI